MLYLTESIRYVPLLLSSNKTVRFTKVGFVLGLHLFLHIGAADGSQTSSVHERCESPPR